MSDSRPIGIFDSGIGGLTVAKAIGDLLPSEQLIYFGDTAHFPYGDKEKKSLQTYCQRIVQFLLEKDCKAIVIACNTASAACYSQLLKLVPKNIPIINVIDPVAHYIVETFTQKTIGVIATKGTISSRVYPKSIKSLNGDIKVHSSATPLLAPMIEEGYFNNNISSTIIASYLEKTHLKNIDVLVLGCTHYPIIEEEIKSFYAKRKNSVSVINSAKIVALNVQKELGERGLFSAQKTGNHKFFVSDFTTSFEQSSEIFFGEAVKLRKIQLWK